MLLGRYANGMRACWPERHVRAAAAALAGCQDLPIVCYGCAEVLRAKRGKQDATHSDPDGGNCAGIKQNPCSRQQAHPTSVVVCLLGLCQSLVS